MTSSQQTMQGTENPTEDLRAEWSFHEALRRSGGECWAQAPLTSATLVDGLTVSVPDHHAMELCQARGRGVGVRTSHQSSHVTGPYAFAVEDPQYQGQPCLLRLYSYQNCGPYADKAEFENYIPAPSRLSRIFAYLCFLLESLPIFAKKLKPSSPRNTPFINRDKNATTSSDPIAHKTLFSQYPPRFFFHNPKFYKSGELS